MKAPYLLSGLLLVLTACNWFTPKPVTVTPKDDLTHLPPETQEGKNTFGCLVNGQVWRNQGKGFTVTGTNLSAVYNALNKTIEIEAINRVDPLRETIVIHVLEEFRGIGVYILNANASIGGKKGAIFNSSNDQKTCVYYTDSLNSGILEITRFDSIAPYIVSGRFSFTVSSPGCDTVRITDGRFDIRRM